MSLLSTILSNQGYLCRRLAPSLILQNIINFSAKGKFRENLCIGGENLRFYSQSAQNIFNKMLGTLDLKKLALEGNVPSETNKRHLTVSVEGNIGCGKTTLLEYYKNSPNVEAIPEPVDQWTNIRGHNGLALIYEDPARWSFSFNMYALLTRMQMHKCQQKKPIKILERSLYSTQYCFVENNFRCGSLNGLEHSILSEWFEWLTTSQDVKIDLFVYLRADPEVCYERLKKRSRKEEAGVPFKLIQDLHDLHEDWLIQKSFSVPAPVVIVDANNPYSKMQNIYEDKRSQILCGYN